MELPKNYNIKGIEENWIKNWLDTKLYQWDSTKSREETFVVDTPPPTVSGCTLTMCPRSTRCAMVPPTTPAACASSAPS